MRTVQIQSEKHGLVAVVSAQSLKKALEQHWKVTLEPNGYTEPQYAGNVLTVWDGFKFVTYTAKDVTK